MLKTIGLIIITAILMVLLVPKQAPAQLSINLQADVNALRSQVAQLQSEVAQLRNQRGIIPTPVQPTPRRARSVDLSDPQIIDRLAVLAIEAKDRLNALESRVTKLERTR